MSRDLLRMSHPGSRWGILLVGLVLFACGVLWKSPGLLGGGAVVLVLVFRAWGEEAGRPQPKFEKETPTEPEAVEKHPAAHVVVKVKPEPPRTSDELVEAMLVAGRYALLLRRETTRHLHRSQIVRAVRQLDEAMALVPGGNVLVGAAAEQAALAHRLAEKVRKEIRHASIDPVYVDRHAVTNRQYQDFIDAGGYEQLAYWDEEALPALFEFLDQTGEPAPRYWSNRQFPEGKGRLPVVGVSWYEANAYARWVGKRLPTDAEWTKAGAWPVESAPGRILQRRYPWGDSFDIRRANIWGSGRKGPVPVDEYSGGSSVNGIFQLVGNVWEWTADPLKNWADTNMHVPDSMKSIRGGAYNTYFENQATCHYLSGESSFSRKANLGFRLVLSMSVLATSGRDNQDAKTPAEPTTAETDSAEELVETN